MKAARHYSASGATVIYGAGDDTGLVADCSQVWANPEGCAESLAASLELTHDVDDALAKRALKIPDIRTRLAEFLRQAVRS